mgnify:CR=1 FL=1
MKRRVTREEIIRTTRDLIIRNGIRAVRVDEIAQTLGISNVQQSSGLVTPIVVVLLN